MKELLSWLILHHCPEIGPIRANAILTRYNSPQCLPDLSAAEMLNSGLFPPQAVDYYVKGDFSQAQADLKLAASNKVSVIHRGHSDYPRLLAEIHDPPLVLYVRGNARLLSMPQIAIVGSRNPDTSGGTTAGSFARALAANGVTITSGLAVGIDRYAHEGALKEKAGTIAVMGTGINRIYPGRNRKLAHKIVENGLLVSEFPPDFGPKAENFPRRNRIISGLTIGTIIVQAALKSGSLITARNAMEQGREVFAVPGSIHNPLYRGCHKLIKNGAKLIETTDDIFDELKGMIDYEKQALESYPVSSKCPDSKLLDYLAYDPLSIDEIAQASGFDISFIKSELLELELAGKVETLTGGRAQRV